MKLKKLFAGILTVAMMFSMTAALAATPTAEPTIQSQEDGTTTYTSELASLASANIWSIKFPTNTAAALQFVVDPQKIVKESQRFGEDAVVADTATMLFPNFDDGELTGYTATSDDIKVENRGTMDVTVSLDAQLTQTDLTVKEAAIGDDDTDASIYISITNKTPSPTEAPKPLGYLGAQFEQDVKWDENAWDISHKSGKYQYALKEDAREADYNGWKAATFSITGESNANDGAKSSWAKSGLTPPNIKLTWNVRSATTDVLPITLPDAGTGYKWAISTTNAYAGQKVSIYLLLKEGYEIASTAENQVPGATTATVNITSGEITDDDALTVTKEETSVNDVIEFTFTMPAATGNTAFSTKTATGDANTVVITGPTVTAKA